MRTLQYLPSYLSFREIGERIHVSPNTVKTQAQAVYRKLDASSRAEAVVRARDAGLLGEDPVTGRLVASTRQLFPGKGVPVSTEELEEMGPIDYLVIEWPGRQPTGEAAPLVVDLVERGIIRVLDLAFIAKAEDGSVAGLEIADLGQEVEELKVFEGASSGLLSDEDTAEAAEALEPGTSAALLVYENSWAAPFASAVRRSGGQLVAFGRIPVQAVLAALDAAEEAEAASHVLNQERSN